jgi:hypothetical protein
MNWKPIETAPKDGTPVDLWDEKYGGRMVNMRRVDHNGDGKNVYYEAVDEGYTCVRTATHWMPIPEPPLD